MKYANTIEELKNVAERNTEVKFHGIIFSFWDEGEESRFIDIQKGENSSSMECALMEGCWGIDEATIDQSDMIVIEQVEEVAYELNLY